MQNLDALAAEYAQKIVSEVQSTNDLENLATKALGVLQENGAYALVLFLQSRTREADKKLAKSIEGHLFQMLSRDPLQSLLSANAEDRPAQGGNDSEDQKQKHLERIRHISENLDHLLLVKQLWEQALIYVRYGAKAQETKS